MNVLLAFVVYLFSRRALHSCPLVVLFSGLQNPGAVVLLLGRNLILCDLVAYQRILISELQVFQSSLHLILSQRME